MCRCLRYVVLRLVFDEVVETTHARVYELLRRGGRDALERVGKQQVRLAAAFASLAMTSSRRRRLTRRRGQEREKRRRIGILDAAAAAAILIALACCCCCCCRCCC